MSSPVRGFRIGKECREFLDEVGAEGWEFVSRAGTSHLRLRHSPTGATAQVSSTPKGRQTRLNELSYLRRRARRAQELSAR